MILWTFKQTATAERTLPFLPTSKCGRVNSKHHKHPPTHQQLWNRTHSTKQHLPTSLSTHVLGTNFWTFPCSHFLFVLFLTSWSSSVSSSSSAASSFPSLSPLSALPLSPVVRARWLWHLPASVLTHMDMTLLADSKPFKDPKDPE